MRSRDWHAEGPGQLGIFLAGDEVVGAAGETVPDDCFYLILNAAPDVDAFRLPPSRLGQRWLRVLDTAHPDPFSAPSREDAEAEAGTAARVTGRSVVVYRRTA
jgi:hypothetical protein